MATETGIVLNSMTNVQLLALYGHIEALKPYVPVETLVEVLRAVQGDIATQYVAQNVPMLPAALFSTAHSQS